MKSMNKSQKIWYKFYECCCGGEGIMMSYENTEEDGLPQIDIAFFQHGLVGRHPLSFWERLRWTWYLIKTGRPFLDEVILNQTIAKELAEDLLEFSKKKYKFGDKK